MIYVVQSGDTVSSIAERWNVSPDRLRYDNQLAAEDTLVIGQSLLILIPETIHQVQEGETASGIAAEYGITLRELLQRNPFLALDASGAYFSSISIPLTPGQYLVIRYTDQSDDPTALKGYAYPFIREDTLRQTLPYLQSLLVFSYGFTESGELIEPANLSFLLSEAARFGVNPVLVLTPMTEEGTFNSNLVSALTGDLEAQETLIDNLMDAAAQHKFTGFDIDFEFIPADSRDDYTSFIAHLAERAHEDGLTVTVALAPKTSADQPGVLYEGVDYGGLGAAADQVLLMAYEWGYTYGPPMAVSPLPNVRRVIEYALTEIPSGKIILGIPNYAYDWPLPFERGTTAAATIGNAQAVELARRVGAQIQYDEEAEAPWFTYREDGVEHIVWFEDARSYQATYALIREYGLIGGGYWNLMRYFRPEWGLATTEFRLE